MFRKLTTMAWMIGLGAAGALEGGLERAAVLHLARTEDAVEAVENLVEDGDVVLVKGSRLMQLERVVQRLAEVRGRVERPQGPGEE